MTYSLMADWARMKWYMRLASSVIRASELQRMTAPCKRSVLWKMVSFEGAALPFGWPIVPVLGPGSRGGQGDLGLRLLASVRGSAPRQRGSRPRGLPEVEPELEPERGLASAKPLVLPSRLGDLPLAAASAKPPADGSAREPCRRRRSPFQTYRTA